MNKINQIIKTKTWVTIGGRIEDYALMSKEIGMNKTRKAIEKTYKSETDFVYAGLKVFLTHGSDVYYTGL